MDFSRKFKDKSQRRIKYCSYSEHKTSEVEAKRPHSGSLRLGEIHNSIRIYLHKSREKLPKIIHHCSICPTVKKKIFLPHLHISIYLLSFLLFFLSIILIYLFVFVFLNFIENKTVFIFLYQTHTFFKVFDLIFNNYICLFACLCGIYSIYYTILIHKYL
jgi:hypothetical protein